MYSNEIYNIVIKKLEDGISVKDISEELKISKSTIYNWKTKSKNEIKLNNNVDNEFNKNKIISKNIGILIKQKKYDED